MTNTYTHTLILTIVCERVLRYCCITIGFVVNLWYSGTGMNNMLDGVVKL